MDSGQKGFIVYGDNEPLFDRLTDEEAGQLLKAMTKYFNHGIEPKFDSLLTDVVWIQIKLQMDRNAEKYKKKCEKNRESIQSYWNKVKEDTNVYERIRTLPIKIKIEIKIKTGIGIGKQSPSRTRPLSPSLLLIT